MREPDATQQLYQDLAARPDTEHLADCLNQIEVAVAKTWKSVAMPWFTDHGPAHSRRVARYANQLAGCPYIPEALRLTVVERFILYAACWLHDIGMQDLTHAGRLGEPTFDYARVRHEHPDRTAELLLEDRSSFGLPADDPVLAEAVAEVARAHGTHTYTGAVRGMRDDPMIVCNEPVRGPLLACLLLIADELDLRHDRVKPFTGKGQIGAVSEAHAFKHQCVQSSEPAYGVPGLIGVRLDLRFPRELSEADADHVERWIVLKLRRQMALVEEDLRRGFGIQFDRRIRVFTSRSRAGWALPGEAALAVIRADNARDALIDHRVTLRDATELSAGGGVLVLRGEWSVRDWERGIDPDGREDILATLAAQERAAGRKVLVSERALVGSMASASDVLEEWLDSARRYFDQPTEWEPHPQADPADEVDLLAQVLGKSDDRWLLTVSCVDLMDSQDRRWLFEVAVPRLLDAGDVTVVLTADRDTPVSGPNLIVHALDIRGVDRDDVRRHLARYLPDQYAGALTRVTDPPDGRRYSDFKRLVEDYEEMLTLDGDGWAQGVYP